MKAKTRWDKIKAYSRCSSRKAFKELDGKMDSDIAKKTPS